MDPRDPTIGHNEAERIAETPDQGGLQETPQGWMERPPSSWWFVEAWNKLRAFVIDFVVEAVTFGLFLLSLEAFHRLVDRTSLSDTDREFLHKFHFYSHIAILVIFAISFIIQVLFRKYEELFEEDREHQ